MNKTEDTQEIFICACHSFEHQAIFWYDPDYGWDELYVYIHLRTYKGFFKRFWVGLKYAFGYSSIVGQWDQFIFKTEDEEKLFKYLEERIKNKPAKA